MTIVDFLKLCKHYRKLVVAILVICVVLACGFAYVGGKSYRAEATLYTYLDAAAVKAAADNTAAQYSEDVEGATVTVSAAANSMTVTAKADTAEKAIDAANEVAAGTAEELQDRYAYASQNQYGALEDDEAESLAEHTYYSIPAKEAELVNNRSLKKYGVAGLGGGIFLAIIAVVCIDVVRKPIRGARHVEETLGVPVLATVQAGDSGERLLANIRFATEGCDCESLALVPVGPAARAEKVADLLQAEDPGFAVEAFSPLSEGMAGAYGANAADATLIVAAEWKDGLQDLDDTLSELSNASSGILGIALLGDKLA